MKRIVRLLNSNQKGHTMQKSFLLCVSLSLLLLLGASCKSKSVFSTSPNPLSERNKIVLIPDSSLFVANKEWGGKFPRLNFSFFDYSIFAPQSFILFSHATTDIYSDKPVFLSATENHFQPFLLFPGNTYLVKMNANTGDFYVETAGAKLQNENTFFSVFTSGIDSIDRNLKKKYAKDYYIRDTTTVDKKDLESMERRVNEANNSANIERIRFLDSLATVYSISNDYKEYVRIFMNMNTARLVCDWLNDNYNILRQHRLAGIKIKNFIDTYCNRLSETEVLYNASLLKGIILFLMPYAKESKCPLISSDKLVHGFDFVLEHFRGASKDFLLSFIMYDGIVKGYSFVVDREQEYFSSCNNSALKKKISSELKKFIPTTEDVLVQDNYLLNWNAQEHTLETILEKHNGRLIFIDFWASWCAPCLKEQPAFISLERKYKDSVCFITISMDKEEVKWKKAVAAQRMNQSNSYRVKSVNSPFFKQYNISTIPRYILIGKDGKIISADAPRPSDPALKDLIENNL